MLPIGKVFEFFGPIENPKQLVQLLFGKKVCFVDNDYEIDWDVFACCAFYSKLRPVNASPSQIDNVCKLVFPEIKKNVTGFETGQIAPLIAIIMDSNYLLVGDNLLYDLKSGEQMDKKDFEPEADLVQVSQCFMISAIMIIEAQRFLQEEPSYARDCPFVKQPKHQAGARKS